MTHSLPSAIRRFCAGVLLVLLTRAASAGIDVKLERYDGPDNSAITDAEGVTSVQGATALRGTPVSLVGDGPWILEFEYFSLGGSGPLQFSPGPPFVAENGIPLPALAHSETWSTFRGSLERAGKPFASGWTELRLDLPLTGEANLKIRRAQLVAPVPGDAPGAASTAVLHTARAEDLAAAFEKQYVSAIQSVIVSERVITIEGTLTAEERESVFLADVPMEFLNGGEKSWASLTALQPDAAGKFSLTVPRVATRDGLACDRLTSRWQLFRKTGDTTVAISSGHYADEIACRNPALPPARPTSKKGLGGWSPNRMPDNPDEVTALGISAVTVNMFSLHQLVSLTPGPDTTPFVWQGRTYFAREKAISRYDRTFLEAEKHGLMVSAILLITNPLKSGDPDSRKLAHPGVVSEGTYAMPDVTSAEGISYYGAILNLLTERWSHAGGPHGRVHYWIIHNEIDFGWVWTNAGRIPDISYMDLYQRSMRLTHLIARQYDPNARAFITLTHHWADKGNDYGYGSKRMLELLAAFCRMEGDFPWALAYHPYPQSLFNPRTWEDKAATFDFNTKKITPQNLEVLDAWMKRVPMRYRGEVRPVHLSENGFNSKDYSPASLEDQAAGMALAWKKMARLSSIESWQYHNWIDNRREGGLKIGLRKFPDDKDDPLGRKPIWYLYQALGTPQENAVAAPYLKTIGISSWDEVLFPGEIH